MGLKIFGDQPGGEAPERKRFADDIVGRFRSGYTNRNRPVALTEWRVTTGDPDVADYILETLGGQEVSEWEATGEDGLQVFTEAKSVDILLHGPKALRQKMVLWSRQGKIIRSGDGQTLDDGTPDPDAHLTLAERKEKAREGTGAEPNISVFFRLAANPDLGIFEFRTGSWSMASDLAYNRTAEELEDLSEDHDGAPIRARLTLEAVSFTAKNGPRAGQTVSYTKPVLSILGTAAA